MRKQREAAETLALEVLAHVAGSPADLAQFVETSGIDPQSLRERAGEAGVLKAVIDFLLADDKRLLDFCGEKGIEPKQLHMARHVLDGASPT